MFTLRCSAFPLSFAADSSLYINLSTIAYQNSGQVVDPFYGVSIGAGQQMGYLKFRIAFVLFRALNFLLNGNFVWALFFWNLFWWFSLCILSSLLFRHFLPERSLAVVLVGLAFLMLFNFGLLRNEITAWIHLPSLDEFRWLDLAYMRPFFPQVPIAFTILYLFLQIKVLHTNSWWGWTAMVLTQVLALATFPYSTLMMAGITGISALALGMAGNSKIKWGRLCVYFVACATSDLLFLVHDIHRSQSRLPVQSSLIHFQISSFPDHLSGAWFMLALLSVLISIVPLPWEIKGPLLGLGTTNLLLLVGGNFLSESTLQISHHAGYFVHATATMLFMFVISAGLARIRASKRSLALGSLGLIVFLALNGSLIAHTTYQQFLDDNKERADLARVLRVHPLLASDLVVARSISVDDDCAWVPLLSPSHVLFCRNAQVLFSPEQNQQIQRIRQALYLYFTGRDAGWVESVLVDPKRLSELSRLMFLGDLTSVGERKRGTDAIRSELIPLLRRAAASDVEMRTLLSRYNRVIVIDNAIKPSFLVSRLSSYLRIEKREVSGQLVILQCSTLPL